MRRLGLVVLVLLGGCGGAEDDGNYSCGLVACSSGLFIDFVNLEPLPGVYVIDGKYDSTPFRCEIELPQPGPPHNVARCSDSAVQLGHTHQEDGSITDLEGFGFGRPVPEVVQFTVRRDDVELGSWTLRPEYTVYAPNGPVCGPICKQGSEEVTF